MVMKSRKSILNFFSPVSQKPQTAQKAATNADDRTAQTASPNQNTVAPAINTQSSPATNLVFASPVPVTTRERSAEAQPPILSQTSANSGTSKRIVSNGEHVVLNSDSDTDSLPDLDWGGVVPSSKTKQTTANDTRAKRTSADEEDSLRRPGKKGRTSKQLLNSLVETTRMTVEAERRIIEHKADLEKSWEPPILADNVISEDILGHAIGDDRDDPGKTHRLWMALQRTQATQPEDTFYFFVDTINSSTQNAFPMEVLPQQRWTSSFQDSGTRDQAFLSGFAQQIFRLQQLPVEVASWMLDQICFDRSEILHEKYFEILEDHEHHIHTLLDIKRLSAMFEAVGATAQALDSNTEISLSPENQAAIRQALPSPLISIARLLQRAAPRLRTKARNLALHMLCYMCLDERVIRDAGVLNTIQDAIEAMLCHFPDNNRLTSGVGSPSVDGVQFLITKQLTVITSQLLSRVTHPILQKRLIRAFPAKSPLTAYLQQYLALSFVLHPTMVDVPLADSIIPTLIHRHLSSSPHFEINKSTDYGHLAARLTLLDVAIGPGPLSVPYKPLVSPTPSNVGSSPIQAPCPESSEVKDFNREVDSLAQHMKLLGNSIVEAGAVADLRILEAKDLMERIRARLEHAVRIGGKKIHNPFGDDDDEEGQVKVSKFFLKAKKPTSFGPSRGIFEDEDEHDELMET